jgi:large subunit ribosomal protein L18
MNHQRAKYQQRLRRRFRVSKRVRGTPDRPRLCIFRTLKHMYAQVIDDEAGKTLVAASTIDKDLRAGVKKGGNKAAAQAVGKAIAQRALAAGVKDVCFDRREFKYHGRVAALAQAAREAGLAF